MIGNESLSHRFACHGRAWERFSSRLAFSLLTNPFGDLSLCTWSPLHSMQSIQPQVHTFSYTYPSSATTGSFWINNTDPQARIFSCFLVLTMISWDIGQRKYWGASANCLELRPSILSKADGLLASHTLQVWLLAGLRKVQDSHAHSHCIPYIHPQPNLAGKHNAPTQSPEGLMWTSAAVSSSCD